MNSNDSRVSNVVDKDIEKLQKVVQDLLYNIINEDGLDKYKDLQLDLVLDNCLNLPESDHRRELVPGIIFKFSRNLIIHNTNKEIARYLISKITRDINSHYYAKSKQLTAFTYILEKKFRKAISILNEIDEMDDDIIYSSAQFMIGKILIDNYENLIDFRIARTAFKNSERTYTYESNSYKKICDLYLKSSDLILVKDCIKFLDVTIKIFNILKLDFEEGIDRKKSFERKLAHYANIFVANKLLNSDFDNKESGCSPFRFNTINNVNDPSEGYLLKYILSDKKESDYSRQVFDKKLHAFISCFTFNHDNLNQFRLYGKNENEEASGVSLVFDKSFFGSRKDINNMISGKKTKKKNNKKNAIDIQPVLRCVYVDPNSNYIKLAQRDKLTFFREFGERIDVVNNKSRFKADIEWEKYQDFINKKTEDFEINFEIMKHIFTLIYHRDFIKKDIKKDTMKLLDNILTPLKYIFKHSAFQEEQECRMVYLTNSLQKPEIQLDFGNYMYIEYKANVKSHLDKIYIAPAATKYRPYLEKLLCDTNVKIELSNNPYRHT